MSKYTTLKAGDVLQKGDEWKSNSPDDIWGTIAYFMEGKKLTYCITRYRRPINAAGEKKEIAKVRGMICRFFNTWKHSEQLSLGDLQKIEAIIRPKGEE